MTTAELEKWQIRHCELFAITFPNDLATVSSWTAEFDQAGWSAADLHAATTAMSKADKPVKLTDHLAWMNRYLFESRQREARRRDPNHAFGCGQCRGGMIEERSGLRYCLCEAGAARKALHAGALRMGFVPEFLRGKTIEGRAMPTTRTIPRGEPVAAVEAPAPAPQLALFDSQTVPF